MKIYLVSAMGHENSGYGDGLVEGGHPHLLISFLDFADKQGATLHGFKHSGKMQRQPLLPKRRKTKK